MQEACGHALSLYEDLVTTYSRCPKRWAFTKGTILAGGRLALPYCLRELRGWLSRGGMALVSRPPCACATRCPWRAEPCLGSEFRYATAFLKVCGRP